ARPIRARDRRDSRSLGRGRRRARGVLRERNMGRTQTHRLVSPLRAAGRVVRHPASGIPKKPDGSDAPLSAKIEPVPGSPWDADQVSRLDLDRYHGPPPRANVEQPPARDDEAHLVLVVPVLAVEFDKHLVEAWSLRPDIDDVRRDVPSALLQLLDLGGIGGDDVLGPGV